MAHITDDKVTQVLDLLDKGKKIATVADMLDIGNSSVARISSFRQDVLSGDAAKISESYNGKFDGMVPTKNTMDFIMNHYNYKLPEQERFEEPNHAEIAPEEANLMRVEIAAIGVELFEIRKMIESAKIDKAIVALEQINKNTATSSGCISKVYTSISALPTIMQDVRNIRDRFENHEKTVRNDLSGIKASEQKIIEGIGNLKSVFSTALNAVNTTLNRINGKVK